MLVPRVIIVYGDCWCHVLEPRHYNYPLLSLDMRHEDHMSHRLQIVEYASPARLGTSESVALESVKTLEGCAIEEHPELIILNLNSLDSKAVTNEKVWT